MSKIAKCATLIVEVKKEDKEKQREANWRLEIERKIRQEASEKGIELTPEQFQKVCERRMKKLTKKLAEKKHRKESSKPTNESSVPVVSAEKSRVLVVF